MMLRIAIVIVTGGQLILASGQSPFNVRFDLFNELWLQEAWGVEADSTGGAMVFFNGPYTQDGFYASSGVSSVHVSADGSFSQGFRFHLPYRANYPGWANSSIRLAEGGYFIGGSTFQAPDTNRVAIYWFDADGVLEHFREIEYLPGRSWIGRQAKQTPDGGFVICGETTVNPGTVNNGIQSDGFVLKTDAQGNQEWVRTYGLPNKFEYANSIDRAPEGGYYIGGQVSTTSLFSYDQWLVRIDAQGEVVWQQNIGTPFDDGPNAHVTTAVDGNCLWASAWTINSDLDQRPCLVKLNPDGGTIWSRMYGPGLFQTTFYVVQEVVAGGDLIAAGQSYVNNLISVGYIHGLLLRTTNTGDSLWMRYYDYYDDDLSNGRGYFRDVQPTIDGGFIAVGQALPVGPYSGDVWVVKTDQHGCIEPGCQLIMGVETQITNLRDVLTVFPNPVASGGNVQVGIALPENFTAQGALRLTVTDALGRIVQEQGVPQGISTLSLPNLQPSTGSYHLHLSDATRWISGTKFVVE